MILAFECFFISIKLPYCVSLKHYDLYKLSPFLVVMNTIHETKETIIVILFDSPFLLITHSTYNNLDWNIHLSDFQLFVLYKKTYIQTISYPLYLVSFVIWFCLSFFTYSFFHLVNTNQVSISFHSSKQVIFKTKPYDFPLSHFTLSKNSLFEIWCEFDYDICNETYPKFIKLISPLIVLLFNHQNSLQI